MKDVLQPINITSFENKSKETNYLHLFTKDSDLNLLKDKNLLSENAPFTGGWEESQIVPHSVHFYGLDSSLNNISEIHVKETYNNELNEILKTNMEPLSEKSMESYTTSQEGESTENLPLFKNYDYNFTEQVYIKDNMFGTTEAEEQITEIMSKDDLHKAHLIQTLEGLQFVRGLQHEDYVDHNKAVYLPPSKLFRTPETTKTLIFDLGKRDIC